MSDTKRLVIFNSVLVIVISCVLLLCFWKPGAALAETGEEIAITYIGNSGAPVNETQISGSPFILGGETLYEGSFNSVLVGWELRTEGGSQHFRPDDTVTFYEDTSLYGIYSYSFQGTVIYHSNLADDRLFITAGTYAEFASNLGFENEGKVCVSWSTKPDGTGQSYTAGDYLRLAGGEVIELYAIWEDKADFYEMTFDNNYLNGEIRTLYVKKGSSFAFPSAYKMNYVFAGWFDEKTGGNFAGFTNDEYTPTSDTVFYAHWVKAPSGSYTLLLGSGGTAANGDDAIAFTGSVLPENTFVLPGWHFVGWASTYGGTFAPGDAVKTGNSYKALWMKNNTHYWVYHYNFLYSFSGSLEVHTERPWRIDLPRRDGYLLLGWNTEADGSGTWVEYIENAPQGTYYAQWISVSEPYVMLKGGYESDGSPFVRVEPNGGEVTLSEDIPSRAGSLFLGWKQGYSNALYKPGDTLALNGNVVLIAVWDKDSVNTAAAIYHTNGGNKVNSSELTVQLVSNSDLKFYAANSNTFSRSNHLLKNWNTKANGSGKTYSFGETLTAGDAPLELYAQWEQIKSGTVYYYGGGSSTSSGATKLTQNFYTSPVTLKPATAFTNGTKKLIAWKSADGKFYKPGSSYTLSGSPQLTAVWQNYNTAVFDANGGTKDSTGANIHVSHYLVSSSDLCYYHSDDASKLFKRSDYGFIGWSEKSRGGTVTFTPPIVSEAQLPVTLYAQWAKNGTYNTVTYVSGYDRDTQNVKIGSAVTLPTPDVRNDSLNIGVVYNKYFTGWYDAAEGGNLIGKAGDNYTPSANVTIYGRWEAYPQSYVEYMPNGAEGERIVCEITQSDELIACPYERAGYTFLGWSVHSNSVYVTADIHALGETVNEGVRLTYFAVWIKSDAGRLTYDANGGAWNSVERYDVLDLSAWTGLDYAPTKKNAVLLGFNTKPDGSGTYIDPVSYKPASGHVTVWAIWDELPVSNYYYVNYMRYGKAYGLDSDNRIGHVYKDAQFPHEVTLPSKSDVRYKDYSLVGWVVRSKDAEDRFFEPGQKAVLTGECTISAIWSNWDYTVYKANGGERSASDTVIVTLASNSDLSYYGTQFELAGYTQTAWNTRQDGKGSTVKLGANGLSRTVLYAVWEALPANYYVFAGNGGFTTASKGSLVTNVSSWPMEITLPECSFVKRDNTFVSWQIGDNFYFPGDKITLTENTRIDAVWSDEYILIHANDSSGKIIPHNREEALPDYSIFTLEGKVVYAFNTKADASGVYYTQSQTVPDDINVLYALWKDGCSIKYVDGDESKIVSGAAMGSLVTLPKPDAKDGYSFLGWYDASGKLIGVGGANYKVSSKTAVLYARWSIRVKFNENLDPESTEIPVYELLTDEKGKLTLPEPQIPYGMCFIGWYTISEDDGVLLGVPGEEISVDEPITVYAQWQMVVEGINVVSIKRSEDNYELSGLVNSYDYFDPESVSVFIALYDEEGKMMTLAHSELTQYSYEFELTLSAEDFRNAQRAELFCIDTLTAQALTNSLSLI